MRKGWQFSRESAAGAGLEAAPPSFHWLECDHNVVISSQQLPQAATPGVPSGTIITRFKNINILATDRPREIY